MKTTTTLAILIACTALFALAGCEEADMQPPAEQSMYGGAEGSVSSRRTRPRPNASASSTAGSS